MRTLKVAVFGDPVPQGSKRAFAIRKGGVLTGRAVVVNDAGSKLAEWRNAIVDAARGQFNGDAPLEGPLRVSYVFYLRKPKRPKHDLPATRPDLDKLSRAVGDALRAAGIYRDDGQIVTASVRKRFTDVGPRVEVFVSEEDS
jgi:crossover junction endodeoxyribonuclease RusA